MLETIKKSFTNIDLKIRKIMQNGLRFSLVVALFGTLILSCYISSLHSAIIYYIGIEIIHLSISFFASFVAVGFAIDKIKKDLT